MASHPLPRCTGWPTKQFWVREYYPYWPPAKARPPGAVKRWSLVEELQILAFSFFNIYFSIVALFLQLSSILNNKHLVPKPILRGQVLV